MSKSILSAIDAEISRLKEVKALLSSAGSAAVKRKPGRPANSESVVAPNVQKRKKRRKLSAEALERIRQAQIKRWAAVRQAAKPDANTAAGAPPKPRKKTAA
jgi:Cu/Ag efflux pump CusA